MLKEKKNNEAIYMRPTSEEQILLLALDCKGKHLAVSQTGSCLFILKIKKMNTSIYFLCYLLIFLFCKIIRLGGGKS